MNLLILTIKRMEAILDLISSNLVVNIVSYSPEILLQLVSVLDNATLAVAPYSDVDMNASSIILIRVPFHIDLDWILFIERYISSDTKPKLVIWSTVPVTLTDDDVTITLNDNLNDIEIRTYMESSTHLLEDTARLIAESYTVLPGNYLVYLPTQIEVDAVRSLLDNVDIKSTTDRKIYLVTPETDILPRDPINVVFDTSSGITTGNEISTHWILLPRNNISTTSNPKYILRYRST